jgi:hypothetical protein
MKVLVCVVSSQENIIESVGRQRDRLIPQELFKNKKGPDYPMNFKVSLFDPTTSKIGFEKFLLHASKGMEAVILLVESRHSNLIASVANAVFATTFDTQDERVENFKNFFGNYFSPLFRHFFFAVKSLMSDAVNEQAMMLPLRNFEADELRELARLSREESIAGNFVRDFEAAVANVMKRRLPRKRSNRKTKYFIDDKDMHFVYGHEIHARFDTGDPHVAACVFNGNFRFGRSIDTSRHYNASFGYGDDTNIAGDFPDCHGALKKVTKSEGRTHVNMFANDFC